SDVTTAVRRSSAMDAVTIWMASSVRSAVPASSMPARSRTSRVTSTRKQAANPWRAAWSALAPARRTARNTSPCASMLLKRGRSWWREAQARSRSDSGSTSASLTKAELSKYSTPQYSAFVLAHAAQFIRGENAGLGGDGFDVLEPHTSDRRPDATVGHQLVPQGLDYRHYPRHALTSY